MKLNDICDNPREIDELNIILTNEYFKLIRNNVEYLINLNERDFSIEFDYVLAKTNALPLVASLFDNFEYVKDGTLTTYAFYRYMNYKILKGLYIINEYMEHCDETNKIFNTQLDERYDDYHFYLNFLSLKEESKLIKVGDSKEIKTDRNEEIKYLKFVAIDNSLTDPNILEDFYRVQFNPMDIEEISFYLSNSHYEWLLGLIKKNMLFDDSIKLVSKIELKKHLKEYGKGFRYGYFNYIEKVENEIEYFSKENKIFINKIFSKVYDVFNASCLPLKVTKIENSNNQKGYQIIEDELFAKGVVDGEIYKAWMIIAEYNPMFRKKWKKENAINSITGETSAIKEKPTKNQTQLNWFKVGLLFATGEIENLFKQHESNFTQIAKSRFGSSWKSNRPYISETYNNTSTNNKNIWSSKTKVKLLYDYCFENSLEMSDAFLNQYKGIK